MPEQHRYQLRSAAYMCINSYSLYVNIYIISMCGQNLTACTTRTMHCLYAYESHACTVISCGCSTYSVLYDCFVGGRVDQILSDRVGAFL